MKEEDQKPGDEDPDESEDSFRKKKQRAIQQLRVILFYLKDFKEICETLKKEKRNDTSRHKKDVQMEPPKPPEPKFVVEAEAPRSGSHNSGSQGNTRELSKDRGTRDTGGSGGDGASKPIGET